MTDSRRLSSAHKKQESKTVPENPSNFSYTPKEVVELPSSLRFRTDLTWGEKCFISELTSLCNKQGSCVYNSKALSELFKVSQATIHCWVKNLADKGKIEVGKKRNTDGWTQYITLLEIAERITG